MNKKSLGQLAIDVCESIAQVSALEQGSYLLHKEGYYIWGDRLKDAARALRDYQEQKRIERSNYIRKPLCDTCKIPLQSYRDVNTGEPGWVCPTCSWKWCV